jgi:hypothetical protein
MNPKEDSSWCETLKAIPTLSQRSGLTEVRHGTAEFRDF